MDLWIGDCPLSVEFNQLYKYRRDPNSSVNDVCGSGLVQIEFRRPLSEEEVGEWLRLVELVNQVDITPGMDESLWVFGKKGRYTTKSLYEAIRLLMGLTPLQIRPYPYFKSPNYHPPRPTPSAQCPNPPQPEVTTKDDMRLTRRSTTIAPQPVPTRLCRQPNPPQPVS